jgi:hypothetical protein
MADRHYEVLHGCPRRSGSIKHVDTHDFSDFLMLKKLPSKSASDVSAALEEIFNQWIAWGHHLFTLRTDPENGFRACQSRVHAMGIRTQFAAVGAHEKKVERVVRTLRERVRVMGLSLNFPIPHASTITFV